MITAMLQRNTAMLREVRNCPQASSYLANGQMGWFSVSA